MLPSNEALRPDITVEGLDQDILSHESLGAFRYPTNWKEAVPVLTSRTSPLVSVPTTMSWFLGLLHNNPTIQAAAVDFYACSDIT